MLTKQPGGNGGATSSDDQPPCGAATNMVTQNGRVTESGTCSPDVEKDVKVESLQPVSNVMDPFTEVARQLPIDKEAASAAVPSPFAAPAGDDRGDGASSLQSLSAELSEPRIAVSGQPIIFPREAG